jgi:uncharacterized protein (TIGR02271 family)
MTTINDPATLIGRTAVDPSGDKVGKVGQVYLDDQTGEPTWVAVSTGLFGNKESFAPLAGASATGDDLTLGVDKETIKGAPNVENDGHLSDDEQQSLYQYYAGYLGAGTGTTTTGQVGGTYSDNDTNLGTGVNTDRNFEGERGGPGNDVSGPNTDSAMTRSEERLQVGTQQTETGRARLRKYVVTENVTQTVPVSHEEVRVEREPITDANIGDATSGPAFSEEEHEVTLHAEQPVVAKEAVPVERVRLDTETVTEQQTVNEEVRKEQIEMDGDGKNVR